MKAFIKGWENTIEVDVKWRSVDSSGFATIVDKSGVRYETHLSNVIFVGVEK